MSCDELAAEERLCPCARTFISRPYLSVTKHHPSLHEACSISSGASLCLQKLTAEQRREAAKRYTLEQHMTKGSVAGAEKRKRLVRVSMILPSLAA